MSCRRELIRLPASHAGLPMYDFMMQVPEWLEEPLLHLVHHATMTLESLMEKALTKFGGRYVVGEELAATDEGKERPCVIRAITSAKRPEGHLHSLHSLELLHFKEGCLPAVCHLLHASGSCAAP